MTVQNELNRDLIDHSVSLAKTAAEFWGVSNTNMRSKLLQGFATSLEQNQDDLIELANTETGLGAQRLTAELLRTVYQLRGFATEVESGAPYRQVDDKAVEGLPPSGRSHLTRVQVPLGPVAMFSASNFPFAFSVLGGDTASALAAGCPVVVKAHTGHSELSRAVYRLAKRVISTHGLPEGVLTLIENTNRNENGYLVQHPDICAVAFTGSYQGGKALWKLANERTKPIPFFGELGSLNPLVVLPETLEREGETLARTLANSITMGAGQFCTKPGIVVVFDHPLTSRFIDQLAIEILSLKTHRMLTPGIRGSFETAVSVVANRAMTVFQPKADGLGPAPRLFKVNANQFMEDASLREEMFGPAAVIVTASNMSQVLGVLNAVEGTLTTTIWGAYHATADNEALVRTAENISGRVLFSGVPTGVAICHAQQHGGPWPASTTPQTTSVGYAAIERFLRPVALQDAPAWVVEARRGD